MWNVAAYLRLSSDNKDKTERESIKNQKLLINDYLENKKDFNLVDYYIDDGFSGTNFNRPAFLRMYQDIIDKKINCVIVKDLSRFGRNTCWVYMYLGNYFPNLGVRFISISENIDSEIDNNYTDDLKFAFLNFTYEQYAIEASKKISQIKGIQQKEGKYIGVSAPYGYIKDPSDCHKIIIDNYSSKIIKIIFDMTLNCKSRKEICDYLNKNNILTPSKYKAEVIKTISNKSRISDKWIPSMIMEILKNEVYIGNMVQGKVTKPIRRLNKRVKKKREDWIVVENTHEPIISKDVFDTVQRVLEYSPTMLKANDVLLKYLRCPDCGGMFYKRKTKYNEYYYCNNYYRKKTCTKHGVIKSILEEMVIEELNSKYNLKISKLNDNIIRKYIDIIYIKENGEIQINFK